jgi:hypothetical protein
VKRREFGDVGVSRGSKSQLHDSNASGSKVSETDYESSVAD